MKCIMDNSIILLKFFLFKLQLFHSCTRTNRIPIIDTTELLKVNSRIVCRKYSMGIGSEQMREFRELITNSRLYEQQSLLPSFSA